MPHARTGRSASKTDRTDMAAGHKHLLYQAGIERRARVTCLRLPLAAPVGWGTVSPDGILVETDAPLENRIAQST
jgi:hypothetical protein